MNAVKSAGWPAVTVVRWVARVLAAGLFLFWGAFFLAHLQWFADVRNLPPPWVVGLVGLHFLMLVGLVLGWRYELAGAAVVLATAIPFFTIAGRDPVLYAGVTCLPAVLWLYCGWPACQVGLDPEH